MATFAEKMLAKYETLLQTATGLDSISVDGQSVRYTGVEAKYRHWKRWEPWKATRTMWVGALGNAGLSGGRRTRRSVSLASSSARRPPAGRVVLWPSRPIFTRISGRGR